jgi:hypothetical protein
MAIVRASTNFLWATLLTDLTGSGTNDGITTNQIAWAEDQNNWYYCTAALAATSSWTALATGGGGTLDAAVADTGTGSAVMGSTAGPDSFTWGIVPTNDLVFENSTTNDDLLRLLSNAGSGDIIAIGNTTNDTTIDIDADVVTIDTIAGSGNGLIIQGGGNSTAARWSVPLGILDTGLTILTLETTGGGNLQVTGGNGLLLDGGGNGSGGNVTIDCNNNANAGTGGGGSVFTLTTGDGATGTAGNPPTAAGSGGTASLTMGDGADGTGATVVGEFGADAGNGGNWSLVAGAGGNGASGSEDDAAPGAGGNIGLTAGAGGTTVGVEAVAGGGNIVLTAGAAETATAMGRIILRTPTDPGTVITETVEVVRLINQGAGTNGGGQFDIYVADYTGTIPTPSFSAPTGSLLVANSTTDASRCRRWWYWWNFDAGSNRSNPDDRISFCFGRHG